MRQNAFCIVLEFILFRNVVFADLPVHSVIAAVKGTWELSLGKLLTRSPASCGAGVPNLNTENLRLPESEILLQREYNGIHFRQRVVLSDTLAQIPNEQTHRKRWKRLSVLDGDDPNKLLGTWTMVYDEGFEVVIGNSRFLGIFMYSRLEDQNCGRSLDEDNESSFGETVCYTTDPTRTILGWYSSNIGNSGFRWGCFSGKRLGPSRVSDILVVPKSHDISPVFNVTEDISASSKTVSWTQKPHHEFRSFNRNQASKATKNFYTKYYQADHYSLPSFKQELSISSVFACHVAPGFLRLPSTDLPKAFSWGDPFSSGEDFYDVVLNQGSCGSCYAVSSVFVLQKRFEIALQKILGSDERFFEFNLSPQSVLSCSMYNQGCDGGYPYLVGKQAREIGIATSHCMEYLASHDRNVAGCKLEIGNAVSKPVVEPPACRPSKRWYAKDYGYVGGCYECSSETSIMREVFYNGPVVVAIDAPDKLFLYSNGVFDEMPQKHGKYCDDPGKSLNGWEFTNHAVAIVGWGETKLNNSDIPTKYWIVRNTWGLDWGKAGYFLMVRGKNLAAVESQAVYLDPDFSRGAAVDIVNLWTSRGG